VLSHARATHILTSSVLILPRVSGARSYLDDNRLEGPLPDVFSTLPALSQMCAVLAFAAPGLCVALTCVRYPVRRGLSNNLITGPLPPSFSALSGMRRMNIAHNSLNGTLPAWPLLTLLTYLQIGFNQLSGSLPALSNMPYGSGRRLTINVQVRAAAPCAPAAACCCCAVQHRRAQRRRVLRESRQHAEQRFARRATTSVAPCRRRCHCSRTPSR
jgi:hypothetical protein